MAVLRISFREAFQEQSATIFGLTTLLASRLIYNVSWLHDVAFHSYPQCFYLCSLHTTFDQAFSSPGVSVCWTQNLVLLLHMAVLSSCSLAHGFRKGSSIPPGTRHHGTSWNLKKPDWKIMLSAPYLDIPARCLIPTGSKWDAAPNPPGLEADSTRQDRQPAAGMIWDAGLA